jgi:integrase/recombinase XerD
MRGPIRRGPARATTARARAGKPVPPNPFAHNLLAAYQAAFHEWEEIAGYSPRTIAHQRFAIARFIAWCDERGLARPQDIPGRSWSATSAPSIITASTTASPSA